jgi:Putative nucleotidyltransferase substrate binding domain
LVTSKFGPLACAVRNGARKEYGLHRTGAIDGRAETNAHNADGGHPSAALRCGLEPCKLANKLVRQVSRRQGLFTIEADHGAALGWFGRLRSERDKQDRPGMVNLKLRGSLPLVEAARLLSLRAGLPETSTRGSTDYCRKVHFTPRITTI